MMDEQEAKLLGDVCVQRDKLRRELADALRMKEAQYDCHGGPGTTQEACGACLTCVMRERDALLRISTNAADAFLDRHHELTKVREELAAVRVCFAEASHNAGPAFVAHEELRKAREELRGIRLLIGADPNVSTLDELQSFIARGILAQKAAEDELNEERGLCGSLADICRATADALKGPPRPLHGHSWHDLAHVAAELRAKACALEEDRLADNLSPMHPTESTPAPIQEKPVEIEGAEQAFLSGVGDTLLSMPILPEPCKHPRAICVGRTGQAQLLRAYHCPDCGAEWSDDAD